MSHEGNIEELAAHGLTPEIISTISKEDPRSERTRKVAQRLT
jgi:hypothetical protein